MSTPFYPGGQCPTLYTVIGTLTWSQDFGPQDGPNPGGGIQTFVTDPPVIFTNVPGPINRIVVQTRELFVFHQVGGIAVNGLNGWGDYRWVNAIWNGYIYGRYVEGRWAIQIARQDGQPDNYNCGNVPEPNPEDHPGNPSPQSCPAGALR